MRTATTTTTSIAGASAAVQAALGPEPATDGHPLVLAAEEVARDLEVDAERVDVEGVSRARVDRLAARGLLAVTAPADVGGAGAAPAVGRAVTELLAGACGVTWFVAAQHAFPLSVLARASVAARSRFLPPLCDGSTLGATAMSHLRRPGPPAVHAVPDGPGWRVDGTVGWCTSWGLADVLVLGAETDDGRILFAHLPAKEQDGLRAGPAMDMAAMSGARTASLQLDGLRVPADAVVDVVDAAAWRERDLAKAANVVPATFGLLRTVCRRLASAGARPGAEAAADLAVEVAERASAVRERAYRLLEEADVLEAVDERLAERAHALQLLTHAATALVAAGAGASMARSHPNQRLAREALFHLVQAQTRPVRQATLDRFARHLPG